MPVYNPSETPTFVYLPDVNVTETAVIALSAGWRNVIVNCSGVLTTDRIQLCPTTFPVGYAIGQAGCLTNGQITVQVSAPLLAIGASYSINCRVIAFR